MAGKKKAEDLDDRAKVRAQIIETPTASDAQVAAAAEVTTDLVTDVRYEMGPRDTWEEEGS